MSTYLSSPTRMTKAKDNTVFTYNADGKPVYFKPPLDHLHPTFMGSTSDYGTSFLSDFQVDSFQVHNARPR